MKPITHTVDLQKMFPDVFFLFESIFLIRSELFIFAGKL